MIRTARSFVRVSAMMLATASLFPATAWAQTVALVHARILPGNAAPIEDATLVMRDGSIVAVGPDVPVPANARVIDLRGATVTPGLIAADTTLGTVEVSSDDGSNDVRSTAATLSAGVDVQYALNPDATPLPVALMGGVTGAIVLPESGREDGGQPRVFGGQGAAISLGRQGPILTRAKIGVVADLGEAGAALAGGSRESAHVLIRAALDEARRFRTQRSSYTGEFQAVPLSRPDLEALLPVLDRKVPLIVGAHRASDIRQAVALAREYNLRVIIRGGEEAWRVAPELAAAGVGVIVNPTDNLPKNFEALGARFDNAQRLAAAGVPLAIVGNDSSHRVREMRLNAGMAVARGLPYLDAIRAMTLSPARMFGLDALTGSLERGKRADLVIWNGDPLEPLVQPRAVYVAGVEQSLETRPRDLAERYAGAPPVR